MGEGSGIEAEAGGFGGKQGLDQLGLAGLELEDALFDGAAEAR